MCDERYYQGLLTEMEIDDSADTEIQNGSAMYSREIPWIYWGHNFISSRPPLMNQWNTIHIFTFFDRNLFYWQKIILLNLPASVKLSESSNLYLCTLVCVCYTHKRAYWIACFYFICQITPNVKLFERDLRFDIWVDISFTHTPEMGSHSRIVHNTHSWFQLLFLMSVNNMKNRCLFIWIDLHCLGNNSFESQAE